MKMPGNQSKDSGLFEYEENTYFAEDLDIENQDVNNFEEVGDFSEYLWMENMEEFDKEVMQRLEEEALMEECIQAMLDDENRENAANENTSNEVARLINQLALNCDVAKASNLNPLAEEFVPRRLAPRPNAPETGTPRPS